MKKKLFCVSLLVIPFLAGITSCGRTPAPEGSEAKERANREVPEELPLLVIEDRTMTAADFKQYLALHYNDMELNQADPALLSRLYDNFVEERILSAMADKADITITSAELPELSEKLNLPADSLPRPILMETARIQKFLYLHYYRDLEVSEKEIQDYYRAHRDEFRKNAEVHLYQILVPTKEKAIQLRGILQNSPDRFEELARTESISPEAIHNGYMGTFEKGTLPEEMENVVFSLPVQTISPLVESKYGHHIFKVTRHTYRRTLSLQRVSDQIRSALLAEKMRAAYQEMLAQAMELLQIESHTEHLDFQYTSQTGENDETENDDSGGADPDRGTGPAAGH